MTDVRLTWLAERGADATGGTDSHAAAQGPNHDRVPPGCIDEVAAVAEHGEADSTAEAERTACEQNQRGASGARRMASDTWAAAVVALDLEVTSSSQHGGESQAVATAQVPRLAAIAVEGEHTEDKHELQEEAGSKQDTPMDQAVADASNDTVLQAETTSDNP